MSRAHHNQIALSVSPEEVFAALITPSAIKAWWFAGQAIVIPEEGGMWMATWGDDEDDPEYISGATISVFDPPNRLVLSDTKYVAYAGPLPFEAELPIEFVIEPADSGCILHVTQTGFPDDPIADQHYEGCKVGWAETLASLDSYLSTL